jgi:hypothetical protein
MFSAIYRSRISLDRFARSSEAVWKPSAPSLGSHRGELYSIVVYGPTLASPDVAAVSG